MPVRAASREDLRHVSLSPMHNGLARGLTTHAQAASTKGAHTKDSAATWCVQNPARIPHKPSPGKDGRSFGCTSGQRSRGRRCHCRCIAHQQLLPPASLPSLPLSQPQTPHCSWLCRCYCQHCRCRCRYHLAVQRQCSVTLEAPLSMDTIHSIQSNAW